MESDLQNTSQPGMRRSSPKWVPIAMVAFTTVGLAIPIVLYWRQRSSLRHATGSMNAPPPPRRVQPRLAEASNSTPSRPGVSYASSPAIPARGLLAATNPRPSERRATEDSFNTVFYALKAFGIATALVSAGATASVVGVKYYMGIETTPQFAHRMRQLVQTRMPLLTERIHRPFSSSDAAESDYIPVSEGEDDAPVVLQVQARPTSTSGTDAAAAAARKSGSRHGEEWTWPEAERRMAEAYETAGWTGWFKSVLEELEAEGEVERAKRGYSR